ncbi:MAG TPA: hypothetical protein DEF18_15800 [Muricauda sp.]|uniref:Uncharacterized protein n=1 Tax=Flagellimonas aurea TaxID=2915619 RepID=A0ABS3G253_9FLAO|nr:hypothetical protein [Allomuricauda aurea]MAO15547.1 hypothetical protein [Allomuricauda sp.]MBO0353480.1 hypothetical protein [Allomuricauda aurea]UBZ13417.1 hypothetical protein LDL77_16215 [Allomuricauda aquimarina]HBU79561.1 hypothetical protein [Allomuricauda sp.]|tara:strand:+ start:781 stop:984 length:204 start_codon:yes stop_codon:yes gene_type:complete
MKKKDQKQPQENTELVKDENSPKRNYIFQKSGITKLGFVIILAILILIVFGIVLSGLFFETPDLASS